MTQMTGSESISDEKNNKKELMYLGIGTAIAKKDNVHYRPEVNYALLVFVQEKDFDSATKLAKQHLDATGWQNIMIDKLNPVDVNALSQAPPEVMTAYEIALVDGSHAMILEAVKSPSVS